MEEIKKPEILTKPKLLNGDVIEPTKLLRQYVHYINEFFEIYDFIEQPFKPEMITEYFERWANIGDKNEKENYQLFQLENTYILWDIRNIETAQFISIKSILFPTPKTLSQFTTNCIQAGIKLTWR